MLHEGFFEAREVCRVNASPVARMARGPSIALDSWHATVLGYMSHMYIRNTKLKQ